jgi:hypothetical protein
MMKWIFGLLVLVNVVFFAVMQWGGMLTEDASNPPVQAELNADKIKLLPPEAISAPESAVAVAASAVAVSAVPQAASQPVVAAPVPVPSVVPAPAPTVKLSCMEWGEFSSADLKRVEAALVPLKLGDRVKQHVIEHTSAYWVYLAPLKNHSKAEQKTAQLKKMGVEDYFIVQESGHWQNAISLGVFRTEEAAKKHLAKLKEQGVKNAKVGERASKLKYTALTLSRLESGLSSQIATLHKEFAESELKLVPCN